MVGSVSSYALASLASPQAPVQSTAPVARRDGDGDRDGKGEAAETTAVQAGARRGPLPASGAVGRSIDISA